MRGYRVVPTQRKFSLYDFLGEIKDYQTEVVMPRGGHRPGAGRPRKRREPVPAAQTPAAPPRAARVEPLEYMLGVMNDPAAPPERRDRMAVAAAPFVHTKAGEQGKKAAKHEAARQVASSSRFGAGPAPKARTH